jgi:Amidohydrolase family
MSTDGVLEHRTVVVRGDRIVVVAPTAQVALPGGIQVIDGAGKWLLPGLADMHVHTWDEDDLTMFVAAGVTTVRNMWGVRQHLTWRSQIARGERLGPTIVTAGPLIDGEPPDWPGSVVLTDPGGADKLVTAQKAAGYDFLKPVSRLSREAYAALAAAAERHGMALSGHVPLAAGLDGVLAARQRSIEHLDGYPAALVPPGVALPSVDDTRAWVSAVVARLDPSRLAGTIERTIAAGTWNCATLVAYHRSPELHDAAALERHVKWIDLVPAAVRLRWARNFEAQSFTAGDSAAIRAFNARLAAIVAALAAANAPILIGTDTGVSYVVPGESMHEEIELTVAAGVPRARVLRAATADAWRYLGRPHEAGVVEVGARADLLLVASDPSTAPLPLIPEGVMVRGRWLPRRQLESRLAEIRKRRAGPVDPWAGAPPLAVGGKHTQETHYEMTVGGTLVGRERLAVGVAGMPGMPAVVGQVADLGAGTETSYEFGPDVATIVASHHTMTAQLTARLASGVLVVAGTDLSGRAVSLTQKLPAGAFVSPPGVGGAMRLVEELAGMKPGSKRTLTSLTVDCLPTVAIVSARHQVERKPDAGGRRVFAVVTTGRGASIAGELVVDQAGLVVSQTLGPPVAMRIARKPR